MTECTQHPHRKLPVLYHLDEECSNLLFLCGCLHVFKGALQAHKGKRGEIGGIFLYRNRDPWIAFEILDLPAIRCREEIQVLSIKYLHEWCDAGVPTGTKSNPRYILAFDQGVILRFGHSGDFSRVPMPTLTKDAIGLHAHRAGGNAAERCCGGQKSGSGSPAGGKLVLPGSLGGSALLTLPDGTGPANCFDKRILDVQSYLSESFP
jgi:hypothetical protein